MSAGKRERLLRRIYACIKCGLRRLRSRPRRPIGIAGVTKSIEARGVYLGLFTIINHPPSFLVTIKMFSLFSFCFLYFCLNKKIIPVF